MKIDEKTLYELITAKGGNNFYLTMEELKLMLDSLKVNAPKDTTRRDVFDYLFNNVERSVLINAVIDKVTERMNVYLKTYGFFLKNPDLAGIYKQEIERLEKLIEDLRSSGVEAPQASPQLAQSRLEHENLVEMLARLGETEKMYVERNYHHDDIRYDIVWKRVEKGTPSHVFEIQKDNLSESLIKLKHAHDLWNSKIFFTPAEEDLEKARDLVSGSFHEIKDKIQILPHEKVKEFYEYKSRFKELEENLL